MFKKLLHEILSPEIFRGLVKPGGTDGSRKSLGMLRAICFVAVASVVALNRFVQIEGVCKCTFLKMTFHMLRTPTKRIYVQLKEGKRKRS